MAVIELDLYAPPEPEPGRPRRRWHPGRYRAAGLVVVLLLALALDAAAVPVPQLWRAAGFVPITPQGSFQVFGGRMFTFDRSEGVLTTTAWRLDPARQLWSHRSAVTADAADTPQGFGWFVRPVGDLVVLQVGQDTDILDAATGAVRRHRAAAVMPLTGSYGVEYDETFASGDEAQSDDNGETIYYGSDGLFHSDPPSHTDVRVVDLATGAVRWSAGFTGGAVVDTVPGRPDVLLFYSRTGFSLRALTTGAVLAARAVDGSPEVDAVFGVPRTSDLLLITGPDPKSPVAGFGPLLVTAYSQATLAPVWTRAEPEGTDRAITVCGDEPCIITNHGLTALDPATGRDRWTIQLNASLRRYGPDVYVLENTQSRVLEVRDPVTGAVRADLRRWSSTSTPIGDAPVLLSHAERGGAVFGLLRPYGRVQPLGRSATAVTECQNNDAFAVCRTPAGADIWAYHA